MKPRQGNKQHSNELPRYDFDLISSRISIWTRHSRHTGHFSKQPKVALGGLEVLQCSLGTRAAGRREEVMKFWMNTLSVFLFLVSCTTLDSGKNIPGGLSEKVN